MQLPPPKDISFLSYHKSSPKVMGERERPGGSVGWGGVRVNAAAGASQWMAVLAAGLLTFSLMRNVCMRQPLPITATSETRQEALKIQHERSQLAAHLGFIDGKMLHDRWSL